MVYLSTLAVPTRIRGRDSEHISKGSRKQPLPFLAYNGSFACITSHLKHTVLAFKLKASCFFLWAKVPKILRRAEDYL